MSQHYQNAAFLTAVQYWLRTGLGPVKLANSNWNFSCEWGPSSSSIVHEYVFPANPGNDWVNIYWPKLVSQIRLFTTSTHKVRVVGGSNVVLSDMTRYFPLSIPSYSGAPNPIPSPYDPLPSPYPNPIYCLPCEDKVFTA